MLCMDSGTVVVSPITNGKARCGNCAKAVKVVRDEHGTNRLGRHGDHTRCPVCLAYGLRPHDHAEHDFQERLALVEKQQR
jgi:hypothetical protein